MKQIARAFLVGESAMEQRITRAKSRIAEADVPFEAPGAVERAERLGVVAAMIYLIFNEGYSAGAGGSDARAPLCEEAIRSRAAPAAALPDGARDHGISRRSFSCSTREGRPVTTGAAASFSWRIRTASSGTRG